MEDIYDEVQRARTMDDMVSVLGKLIGAVERYLNSSNAGAEELQPLADHTRTIRRLVAEIERWSARTNGETTVMDLLKGCAERCLDLEGRIKELRNDRRESERSGTAHTHTMGKQR